MNQYIQTMQFTAYAICWKKIILCQFTSKLHFYIHITHNKYIQIYTTSVALY